MTRESCHELLSDPIILYCRRLATADRAYARPCAPPKRGESSDRAARRLLGAISIFRGAGRRGRGRASLHQLQVREHRSGRSYRHGGDARPGCGCRVLDGGIGRTGYQRYPDDPDHPAGTSRHYHGESARGSSTSPILGARRIVTDLAGVPHPHAAEPPDRELPHRGRRDAAAE